MKKLLSLIKASMTSDMNIFKINQKANNKKSNLRFIILISIIFMFSIWTYANILFEKMSPMHLQNIVLSLFVFLISILTIMEGIYKTGSLLFNCKDDNLLLSLPIKKSTVLFLRIFKFYVFELMYNSLFIIPLVIAYLNWSENISWTFFLTSFIMIFFLPIIPIIISCILGAITTSLSSRFKYKNAAQIITTMIVFLIMFYVYSNVNNLFNYIIEHAKSVNDLITKIYYPAGVYSSLATKFNPSQLLIFILINIILFIGLILILSKFYFKINSRIKKVTISKKININNLNIKAKSITNSLIKKELNTFFKTPVFIINAGFGLVLYIIIAIAVSIRFNKILEILTDPNTINLSKDLIMNNLSILIFAFILLTAYMTSITNSVISLEGKNINTLKTIPIKTKTILMSKIYTALILTTPILLIGDTILFIRFKINIIEAVLLILLSVLVPLVSHFIGLIVNLKYPKLDFENSAEVIKQSTSSFISVMTGMVLLFISIIILVLVINKINSILLLTISVLLYIILDTILYLYLKKNGTKEFNKLSI